MRTLLRILRYLGRFRRQAVLAYGSLLISNILNLTIPWLIRLVVDEGLAKGDRGFVVLIGFVILGIALVRGIFYNFLPHHRLAVAPLSHIAVEARARSLLIHAFHTFPDDCAIVKTQSLFEFKR